MPRFLLIVPVMLAALAASAGCASMSGEKDVLISQNKMYEKRNLLLERENGVLRSETAQAIESRHTAEAHAEKAESDRKTLQKKYDEDTALLRAQAESLAAQNAEIRKKSSERIHELTVQITAVEKKYGEDIRRLNEEMKTMAESFAVERETLKKDSARRETEFAEKTNELEKTIAEKDRRIAQLEKESASFTAGNPARGDQPEAKDKPAARRQDSAEPDKAAQK